MKNLILVLGVLFLTACQGQTQKKKNMETAEKNKVMKTQNIYQFKVKDIEGNEFDFATLKGKKIMVVNTASECGLTPQYEQLQKVYSEYKDKNFVIVGFPANNFGAQEPGNNKEIKAFCTKNYGVTFPMMEKISVKGADMHPLYHFLTEKSKNGLEDNQVEWNFQKYLINEKGELDNVISPRVLPNDKEITDWIKG
ncbi:putative glutathione peroxidase [Flavobacterium cauense R2A-7]|uniref:Glutathione peroxidase n=1 Tax=Flavobacterium cauense R2A-7 TaxID=1341154 RepID=V6S4V5_9FLAO|nr:glutathione peroxidase [Flavobacterium cauense]ESU21292.1 putative glutathione peroxidase [Flavobacterium cauense R2A-7]KGO80059.1 glutathione peroxidase [Flavobacterium cauense R2A-7]TWI08998.1 glutathione peroxidase [Flavobacterium cauense R2A-7]